MKKIGIAFICLAIGIGACADSYTLSQQYTGDDILSFAAFDTDLGTLDSVTWTLNSNIQDGWFTVNNNGDTTATDITMNLGATTVLKADQNLGFWGTEVELKTSETVNIGDHDSYTLYGASLSDSGSENAGNLAAFLDGPVSITVDVSQFQDFDGAGDLSGAFDAVDAFGTVQLTYNYTVPEPVSVAMIGVVGALAIGIRRRFMS